MQTCGTNPCGSTTRATWRLAPPLLDFNCAAHRYSVTWLVGGGACAVCSMSIWWIELGSAAAADEAARAAVSTTSSLKQSFFTFKGAKLIFFLYISRLV
jgi:hypothetical protein